MKGLESQFEGDVRAKEVAQYELARLRKLYSCGVDAEPQWCVYGRDQGGGFGVIDWIKPCEEERLISKNIARYINTLGGSVKVEATEWNKKNKGNVVYKSKEHLDRFADAFVGAVEDGDEDISSDDEISSDPDATHVRQPYMKLLAGSEKNAMAQELEELLEQYLCLPTEGANWSVSGDGHDGKFILYWILPVENDEFIARKIAKYINKLGGNVVAEPKTKMRM